jgi:3-oxoacyl-[acyl-carrier protein] reductase
VTVVADVTQPADVDRIAEAAGERLGGVDVLVNNAGGYASDPFLEMTRDQWDAMIDLNLTSVFLMCRRFAPMLVTEPGACIVNLGSINSFRAEPGGAHYSVAKAGVEMLTKSLAVELAPHRIRVNAVSPGMVYTDMTKDVFDSPDEASTWIAKIPAGRAGYPAEVAGVVAFLASDDAAYITGEVVEVNGGMAALI